MLSSSYNIFVVHHVNDLFSRRKSFAKEWLVIVTYIETMANNNKTAIIIIASTLLH